MKTTKEKESPLVASGRSHTCSTPILSRATWLLAMQHHVVIALVTTTPFRGAVLVEILSYMKRLRKSNTAFKILPNLLQIVYLKSDMDFKFLC